MRSHARISGSSTTLAALAIAVALGGAACSESGKNASASEAKSPVAIVGIDPSLFTCQVLITPEAMASALGGAFETIETQFEPAVGRAMPCHYVRRYGDVMEPWSFDMDCREQALGEAETLIKQYEGWKSDAGSYAVDVGKKGIDHHGQALIFIDDDTPCYVRVHGPDSTGRLALAQILAQNLVESNAPMRVSYRRQ